MFDMKLKSLQAGFFDRKAVVDKVGQAGKRVLSRFGAFVRRRAQTSIRKRKGISTPGGPPHSHAPHLLRKFLFFAYDQRRESVVIGPAKLNRVVSRNAPEALEYGGRSTVLDFHYLSGQRRAVKRQVQVQARPFMGPAYEAEKPQLDRLWKDSVR